MSEQWLIQRYNARICDNKAKEAKNYEIVKTEGKTNKKDKTVDLS